MTRIIAGFAGSLRLAVPRFGTRPTSDRVREAIFSSLDAAGVLPGARVVDLYAGSGALGLEAASRGASRVVLVERSHPATQVCRANAALVLRAAAATAPRVLPSEILGVSRSGSDSDATSGSDPDPDSDSDSDLDSDSDSDSAQISPWAQLSIEVTGQPVQAFLTSALEEWDVAFLDPPYDLGMAELVHNLEQLAPRLAPHAIAVIERGSRDPEPAWPDGIALERRKDYGDTTLWWVRRDSAGR